MLSPRWDAVQRKLPQDDRRAPPTPPANVDLVLTGKVKRAVLEQYNQVRAGSCYQITLIFANLI